MATLRGWWKEDPALSQSYFNNVLHHEGKAPQELSGSLCEEIVLKQLKSPSLLCVLPLQDWLSVDENLRCADIDKERINVPAIPLCLTSLNCLILTFSFNKRSVKVAQ